MMNNIILWVLIVFTLVSLALLSVYSKLPWEAQLYVRERIKQLFFKER